MTKLSIEQKRPMSRTTVRQTAGLALMGTAFVAAEMAMRVEELLAWATDLLPGADSTADPR